MPLATWQLAAKCFKRGRFGGLSFYGCLFIVLAITAFVYLPGLNGPFLFDDFANLPPLGETGPIHDTASFARYITSGTADPTGRPVALLTFLLDAQDWPAEPYPFKRTNLILHLTNAALLALLLRRLGRIIYRDRSRLSIDGAAVLAATLWMLHPLFVSTTMYVVQREAILPATTTLCGLLLWLQARRQLAEGRSLAAWITGVGILFVLVVGTFAKANGILLPLFIVVIEAVAKVHFEARGRPIEHRALPLFVAYLPALTIAVYLVWQGLANAVHGIPYRSWTLAQRLLTEPRVLWDYLRLLCLPTPFTSGVFNDDYRVSTSFAAPWTTLPALLGLLLLGVAAWSARRRYPAWSLAVLFFLAGHSLESTTVPLEIYFEHRNYVPALLLFWPFALWIMQPTATRKRPPAWKLAIGGTAVLALAAMTYANAALWGDSASQALVWARLNPNSSRAQVLAAQNEVRRGKPQLAIERLSPLLQRHPEQIQLSLNLLSAECSQGAANHETIEAAELSMRTAMDSGSLLTSWFTRAISVAKAGDCQGLSLDTLDKLASAGIENEKLPSGRKQDLIHLRGQIALANSRPDLASNYFSQATLLAPRPALALTQAAALGSAGFPQMGQDQLSVYLAHRAAPERLPLGMPRLHAWILERQGYWDKEIQHLERQLQSDIISNQHQTDKR